MLFAGKILRNKTITSGRKKLGVVLFIASLPFLTNAQDPLNKTVEVTNAYDPIISDAEKIELPAVFADTLFHARGEYHYSIRPQTVRSNVALQPIPSAKIHENIYKDPRQLYVRVGAGWPLNILGDVYLQNLSPKDMSYGLSYNHRSIWHSIDSPSDSPGGEKVPVDEMNHGANAYFRKNFSHASIGLNGGFGMHNVLFHGFDRVAAQREGYKFDKQANSQSYLSFHGGIRLNSLAAKGDAFRYGVHLTFDRMGDNGKNKFDKGRIFAQTENKIGAALLLESSPGKGRKHFLTLKADGNFFMRNLAYNKKYDAYFSSPLADDRLFDKIFGATVKGHNISNNNYIYSATPSYQFVSDLVELELGVKYSGYRKGEAQLSHNIYPVAGITFKPAEEIMIFGKIGGGVRMNDYKSMVEENPFITPGMNMATKASNRAYEITAGLKGNLAHRFSYNIYGKYSMLNDDYFYVNAGVDTLRLGNAFDVLYDDVQELKLAADMKLLIDPVEFSLSGAYYSYILDKAGAAFHRPTFTVDAGADVSVGKHLKFGLYAGLRSKTPYAFSAATGETSYNDLFFDLGANVEYLLNYDFSIFLNANNLTNSRYGIWHGYRLPGISVTGGVTFRL
jgi:hypothetical protein